MKIFFKATFIRERPVFSTELESPDYFQLEKINYDPVPALSWNLLKDILDKFPFIPSLPEHHKALDYNFLQLKLLSGKNFLSRMKRIEEDFFRIKRQNARENASAFMVLQKEFLREIKIEIDTLRIIEEECLKSNFHFKQAFSERRGVTKKHLENHLKALDQSANWFDKKLDELENEHSAELARELKNQILPSSRESILPSSKTSLVAVLEAFPSADATKLGIALRKIYRYMVQDFDHFQPTQKCLLKKSELHFERPVFQKSLFQSEIFDQSLWKQLSHFSEALQKTSSVPFPNPGALAFRSANIKNHSTSSFLESLEKSTRFDFQTAPPNLLKDAKFIAGIRAFSVAKNQEMALNGNQIPVHHGNNSEISSSIFGSISKIKFDVPKEAASLSAPQQRRNPFQKWSDASYPKNEECEDLIARLEDQKREFADHFKIQEFYPPAFAAYRPKAAGKSAAKENTPARASNSGLESTHKESAEEAASESLSLSNPIPKEQINVDFAKDTTKSLSLYSRSLINQPEDHFYPVMEVKWARFTVKQAQWVPEEASAVPLDNYKENQNISQKRVNWGERIESNVTENSNDGKESTRKITFRKKLGA
ncbi:MAG: hypothetical protein WCI18_10135 [Pseudomonadota bacterium]